MSDKSEQRQGWSGLLMYTCAVLAFGFLMGHLLTLCPTPGLRAALYPWHMLVMTGVMGLFALGWFVVIGWELTEAKDGDN